MCNGWCHAKLYEDPFTRAWRLRRCRAGAEHSGVCAARRRRRSWRGSGGPRRLWRWSLRRLQRRSLWRLLRWSLWRSLRLLRRIRMARGILGRRILVGSLGLGRPWAGPLFCNPAILLLDLLVGRRSLLL